MGTTHALKSFSNVLIPNSFKLCILEIIEPRARPPALVKFSALFKNVHFSLKITPRYLYVLTVSSSLLPTLIVMFYKYKTDRQTDNNFYFEALVKLHDIQAQNNI